MRDSICPKCGCKEIMSDVKIVDHGHGNSEQDFTAAAYANPHALIFRGAVSSRINAYVCSECGYTELYVAKPKSLLKVIEEKQKKKAKKV